MVLMFGLHVLDPEVNLTEVSNQIRYSGQIGDYKRMRKLQTFVFIQTQKYVAHFVSVLCMFIFMLSLTPVSISAAQEMQLDCKPEISVETRSMLCDFQLQKPEQLESLSVTVNGTAVQDFTFEPYSSTQNKSAWLYLVDRSNPRRAATVKRNIEIVGQQLRLSSPSRLVGLATFANDLELVLKPDQSHASLDVILSNIKANGAATEMFSNSIEAIKILANVEADRKALVIMSDGKAEDTAYNRADVVKAAKEAGVTIISLGFAEVASDTPALQELRRLAEETGGYFASVIGNQPFENGFLNTIPRFIENGGVVNVPLGNVGGAVEVQLSAALSNGRTIVSSNTTEVEPPVIVDEPYVVKTLAGKIFGIFEGVSPGIQEWADANSALAYLIIALLPILVLIALFFFLRTKEKEQELDVLGFDVHEEANVTSMISADAFETQDQGTRHISGIQQLQFGHFEIVGNEQTIFGIDGQSMSIGRHSDNDIQLSNDSVHRHHAHLHISPEGVPTINDLDTVNGVFVNGQKIDKKGLVSGDLIELGEVRLRFVGA